MVRGILILIETRNWIFKLFFEQNIDSFRIWTLLFDTNPNLITYDGLKSIIGKFTITDRDTIDKRGAKRKLGEYQYYQTEQLVKVRCVEHCKEKI